MPLLPSEELLHPPSYEHHFMTTKEYYKWKKCTLSGYEKTAISFRYFGLSICTLGQQIWKFFSGLLRKHSLGSESEAAWQPYRLPQYLLLSRSRTLLLAV
jgi:hypothetical protein